MQFNNNERVFLSSSLKMLLRAELSIISGFISLGSVVFVSYKSGKSGIKRRTDVFIVSQIFSLSGFDWGLKIRRYFLSLNLSYLKSLAKNLAETCFSSVDVHNRADWMEESGKYRDAASEHTHSVTSVCLLDKTYVFIFKLHVHVEVLRGELQLYGSAFSRPQATTDSVTERLKITSSLWWSWCSWVPSCLSKSPRHMHHMDIREHTHTHARAVSRSEELT